MKTSGKSFWREAAGIFACAVFVVYSWLMLIFFWDLPAFLLRFSIGEIISFLSYQLMYALFESTMVTAFTLGLVYIIPVRHIKRNLSATGCLLVFSFALSAILFKELIPLIGWLVSLSLSVSTATMLAFGLWLFTLLALPIFAILALKNQIVGEKVAAFAAENLSVLAQMYTLLGVSGIFIVIYQNLF